MKLAALTLILLATVAYPLDLDSYCKGFCLNRYQDGIERNGKCACIDYFPINTSGVIDPFQPPHRAPEPPKTYYFSPTE